MKINGNLTFDVLGFGQLENAIIERLPSAPATTVAGRIYYDTTTNFYNYYNGTSWQQFAAASSAVSSFQTTLSGLTPSTTTTGAIVLAGTLGPASGGTGASAIPTNGQILVGNGSTFTVTSLGSGTGISTTAGAGTLQINNTGVTSIVAGTNISVSGATGAVTVNSTGATLASTFVGYGSAGNLLTGTSDFTWSESTATLSIGASNGTGTLSGPSGGGGTLQIQAGVGTASTVSGNNLTLTTGAGGATNQPSGAFLVSIGTPGAGANAHGGNITFTGASTPATTSGGAGSSFIVQAGGASSAGGGGSVSLATGISATGTSGSFTVTTGTTAAALALTINPSGALGVGTGNSVGTAGQTLTSAGAGGPPTWTTTATTLTATQVAYGSATNTVTSTPDFTWTETTKTLSIGSSTVDGILTIPGTTGATSPNLNVTGSANTGSGRGGIVIISGGTSSTSVGGQVTVQGGQASGIGQTSGDVVINGGGGGVSGVAGGRVFITGGITSSGSLGGGVIIAGGHAGAGPARGEAVTISGGPGMTSGPGGAVILMGGTSPSGTGGSIILQTGDVSVSTQFTINDSGALGIGSTPSFGTAGQVLTSGGSSTSPPTWAAPAAPLTATFIGYGSAGGVLTGTSDFTWTDTTETLAFGNTSLGGNIVMGSNIALTVKSGPSTDTNPGRALTLTAGAGSTANNTAGGVVNLTAGAAGGTGNGGAVTVAGGAATGTASVGGAVTVAGGAATGTGGTQTGGVLTLQGGNATGSGGNGGGLNLEAGVGGSDGSGGTIQFQTGATSLSTRMTISAAGDVTINTPASGTALTINGISAGTGVNLVSGALGLNGSAGTSGQVLTSAGAGALPTWSNVANSILGTANQINASSATGTVTLSLSSTLVAPGSVTSTGNLTVNGLTFESATTGITAFAGGGQSGATPLTHSYNVVTTVATANDSVVLPASGVGLEISVVNLGAHTLAVFPAGGDQIDGGATGAAVLIPTGGTATYQSVNSGNWYTIDPVIVMSGTGLSVTYSPGETIISNTGVTSFATTLAGITASPVTGAVVLSGTLGVASGGTGATTLTTDGILFGNGTGTVGVTAAGTQFQVLQAGSGGTPAFGAVNLAQSAAVTGLLGLTNGGTNANLTPVAGAPVYSTASALAIGTAGTAGQALISGGTGAPTWQSVSSTLTTNQILEGDGSGMFVANGASFVGTGSFSGVTLHGTVTSPTDAATKAYVDAANNGLSWKTAVTAGTTENFFTLTGTAPTYNNGASGVGATLTNAGTQAALVLDGITLSTGQRVLVKNESNITNSSGVWNGIYTVTNTGSGSTNWVLTRATDNNTPAEMDAAAVFITDGTTQATTGWVQSTQDPITIGTTSILFSQFSGGSVFTFTSGLNTAGNVISVRTDGVTTYIDGLNNVAVDSSATAGQVLTSSGTHGTTATWSAVNLANANAVTGTLAVGNGGTGATTLTTHGVLLGEGTSSIVATAVGATGTVLTGNTGADPTFVALNTLAVTSIAGTANEIAASSSVGSVTLSLPSTVVLPGSLEVTTTAKFDGLTYQSTGMITANGTTQGAAAPLGHEFCVVTATPGNTAVLLPVPAFAGAEVTVVNVGSMGVLVFPASGAAIDGAGANNSISVPAGGTWTGQASTTTQWYSIDPVVVNGIGISVTYNNGNTSISNTGVLSFNGGTTGLTPSSTMAGNVTLGGTLVVSNGGTGATSFTSDGVVYGNGTGALQVTAAGTTGQILVGNTGGAPSWANASTTAVTSFQTSLAGLTPSTATTGAITLAGTLGLASGGTNASLTATAGGLVYGTGTALAVSTAGTTGQIVLSGGTGAPTFLTNSTPIDTDGSGTVPLVVGSSFNIFGTPNEITTTAVSSPAGVTIAIPTAFIAPGSVEVTTTLKIDTNTASAFLFSDANSNVVASASPTNGQLLIGSTGANPVVANIVTSGSGISVTNGAGSITLANTGVTSLAGTANEITASASTGSVTLSVPSAFIAPGSVEVTTTLKVDTNTAKSFVYSDAGNNLVTTSAPTNGQLLIGSTGNVPVAANITTTGAGISVTNGAGSIQLANTGVTSIVAGTGISISGGTGAVTVNNTGVTSFQTSLSGLTPSASTTGAVTLAGILGSTSGGTGVNNSAAVVGTVLVASATGVFTASPVQFTYSSAADAGAKKAYKINHNLNQECVSVVCYDSTVPASFAVNTTSTTSFTIAGSDQTAIFVNGFQFAVVGSTSNDGTWTVSSSVFTGGNTVITVTSAVTTGGALGTIYVGPSMLLPQQVLFVDANNLIVTLTSAINIFVVIEGVPGITPAAHG